VRAALERAAVAGRAFWRGVVEDATPPGERPEVAGALMALVRRRLVQPERSVLEGEDGFRFHHALIRDVAYAGISAATRAEIHESVARSLDGRHTALDELVGHHLEQAALLRDDTDLAREAGGRLGAAGMRALMRVDATAAINLLTRSIALAGDDPSGLELEWGLATAVKFAGDPSAADLRYENVAGQALRQGNRVIELRSRIEQTWPRLARGVLLPYDALSLAEETRVELEAASDVFGLARSWHLTAAILQTYLFRSAEAELAATRAAEGYARCGFTAGGSVVALAVPVYRGPMPVPDAIDRCRNLLASCETPVWASFVLPFLAVVEAMGGGFDDARRHLRDARIGREEFSDHGTIMTSWSALAGEVELLAGRPDRAEAILVASVEALREAGDAGWLATNAAWLAEAQYRLGKFEDALRLSAFARSTSPRSYLTSLSVAGRVHAKSLAQAGRLTEAQTVADETAELLASTDAIDERGEVAAATAEVLALAGDDARARRAASEALAFFEQKGNVASAERVSAGSEWGKPA
jgi:tetratricopeptide (TPR) repeat protein